VSDEGPAPSYEWNVFINCPFDKEYFPLLRPLLFTIIYLGCLRARQREWVTVFRDLDVAREPLAGLLLFREAARRETATAC